MYTEITEIPRLSCRERTLLEAHTLLNIYRVICAELMHFGRLLVGDESALAGSLAFCDELIAGLERPETLYTNAAGVNEQEIFVFSELDRHLRRAPEAGAGVGESVANLRSLFAILRARARELLLRNGAGEPWVSMPVALLEAEFRDVFAAIEQNSHGRFRIVFNHAIQRSHDYHMTFDVDAGLETAMKLPLAFPDVIRDLVANARKYTPPGGRIRALLRSNGDGVRLLVEDNGRGIPAGEIPAVVHFGIRGSNVRDVRALGGGFGLTKAFVVTKKFGGRFWIDSGVGVGTRIRIWLPPAPAASPAGPVTSGPGGNG